MVAEKEEPKPEQRCPNNNRELSIVLFPTGPGKYFVYLLVRCQTIDSNSRRNPTTGTASMKLPTGVMIDTEGKLVKICLIFGCRTLTQRENEVEFAAGVAF